MGRHAEWEVVSQRGNIIMIQDLDRPGCLSITNDAEYVYAKINRSPSWRERQQYRIVYRSSIPDDWTEIVMVAGDEPGNWRVAFKPWHGEVWDTLSKKVNSFD